MSEQKQFDKDLYDCWDSKGKNKISNIVKNNTKFKVVDPINQFDVDLLVYDEGDYKFNIEVEIKLVWGTKEFPYNTVQFPARKEKFCHKEKPTLFVMFNKDTSSYLCVTSKDLLDSPTHIVRNKYVRDGEYFFQVPVEKVIFNDITKAIKRLGITNV